MHTILVADDSVTIQRAVEIVFDKEPFSVIKASSGAEALKRAREQQPHVVLVDHTMPDQNGYDLAAALKADPSTQQIPVLFFSAAAQPFDEARGRAAGVAGFLQKPFDCQSLLDRVRALLGVAATAPGSFVGAPSAVTSAAAAALPRPPSLGGLPRPPGMGIPRPASGPPVAPVAANGAPTSVAGKPLDPFGFGNALSKPPQPAGASTPAAPATPATPAGFSSPSSVTTAPAQSGWQAMAPGAGMNARDVEAPRSPTPSWLPTTPAPAPAPAPVAPVAPAPVQARTDDLMEISDLDLVGDPDKITAKRISVDAIAAAAAAAPEPTTSAAAISRAVDVVVQAAAPAVAVANGGAPSKEVLTAEARSIIERIAWEVVPELAELIIKEELQRLLKAKGA